MAKQKISAMIPIILTVCIITPFANDIYVVSLPSIGEIFHSTHTQLVMSSFLLGLGTAQLFYGPLSDRFGRKPTLLVGLGIFVFGSLGVLSSTSFSMLLLSRFVQALGACSTVGSALAIARDVYAHDKLLRATGYIMAIIAASAGLCPAIGTFFQVHFGWRGSFTLLLVLGLFYFAFILLFFKETIAEKNMTALNLPKLKSNYLSLLQNKAFLGCILTSAFSYSTLFSFAGISAHFVIDTYHYSYLSYAFFFSIATIIIILGSLITPRILHREKVGKALAAASLLILCSGLLMLFGSIMFKDSIYAFILPLYLGFLGAAVIRPTASGGSMSLAPKPIAGSAAALFNFASFAGSAATTFILSMSINTLEEFAFLIICLGVGAIFFANMSRVYYHKALMAVTC